MPGLLVVAALTTQLGQAWAALGHQGSDDKAPLGGIEPVAWMSIKSASV